MPRKKRKASPPASTPEASREVPTPPAEQRGIGRWLVHESIQLHKEGEGPAHLRGRTIVLMIPPREPSDP